MTLWKPTANSRAWSSIHEKNVDVIRVYKRTATIRVCVGGLRNGELQTLRGESLSSLSAPLLVMRTTTAASEVNHAPRYLYDCSNCKFSWCCGPTCHCILSSDGLPDPPRERQDEVDAALIAVGLVPEFHGTGAHHRYK